MTGACRKPQGLCGFSWKVVRRATFVVDQDLLDFGKHAMVSCGKQGEDKIHNADVRADTDHKNRLYPVAAGPLHHSIGSVGLKGSDEAVDAVLANQRCLWFILQPLEFRNQFLLAAAAFVGHRIEKHGSNVWLVNTGWNGGSAQSGAKRISIKDTRAIITAILNGSIENSQYQRDVVFGLQIPETLDGVDSNILKRFSDLITQAKKMQEKMKETQEALKKIEVEGISGGNAIRVIMNGDGELKKISLDENLLKESKEIVEDLIVAAHNDAKSKLKKKTSEEISKVTGGVSLPPGFKLPF